MDDSEGTSVGVAVLTLHSRAHLSRCLPPIVNSPVKPRVLVVDSSSCDGTAEEAERLGAETLVIPRESFNHGSTRELARRRLGTNIIVMLSPDAYACDESMLGRLIAPVLEGRASLAYGRQIPHDHATLLEAFPRLFNYGEQSHIRSLEDAGGYQGPMFFCSDAWGAYRSDHLDDIGGFVPVLHGEDHIACAMLLRKGYRAAYVADAVVRHSHRSSLRKDFAHYFDVGYVMSEYRPLFEGLDRMESRGIEYAKALSGRLWKQGPYLLPYAALDTVVKWLGYRAGRASLNAPAWLKRALSHSSFYWKSAAGREKTDRS